MARAPALDALRGAAALSIVALHAWLYTTTTQEKADSLLDGAVHQLRLGVPLFFCLSGYLLYHGWVLAVRDGTPGPRLRDYARRRAWRIVPAYAVALAGSLALLAPLSAVRGVDVPDAHLVALFAVFASNLHPATVGALDPPMWTLAVEVQFYVLLPVLAVAAMAVARRGHAWALAVPPVALVAAGTAYNLHHAGRAGSLVTATSLAALAPCFGCGMSAALLTGSRALASRRAGPVALLVAGLALVVADGVWHEQDAGYAGRVLRDLPAAIGFAAIVLVGATRARQRLAWRPVQRLGELSFAIYLWHMPLMLALRGAGLFPEGRPLPALAAVLAVTLPVAWLSWTLVERPLVRRCATRERPRRTVGADPAAFPAGAPLMAGVPAAQAA